MDSNEIQRIVDSRKPESHVLDFKKEQKVKSDDRYKGDVLRDVVAMANREGGHILIGVDEKDRCASKVLGVSKPNGLLDKIMQWCRDSIEPALYDLNVDIVKVEEKDVLVVEIPDGRTKPYAYYHDNRTTFSTRITDHTRDLNRGEIERLFEIEFDISMNTRHLAAKERLAARVGKTVTGRHKQVSNGHYDSISMPPAAQLALQTEAALGAREASELNFSLKRYYEFRELEDFGDVLALCDNNQLKNSLWRPAAVQKLREWLQVNGIAELAYATFPETGEDANYSFCMLLDVDNDLEFSDDDHQESSIGEKILKRYVEFVWEVIDSNKG